MANVNSTVYDDIYQCDSTVGAMLADEF